jgi:hypothetical protein
MRADMTFSKQLGTSNMAGVAAWRHTGTRHKTCAWWPHVPCSPPLDWDAGQVLSASFWSCRQAVHSENLPHSMLHIS